MAQKLVPAVSISTFDTPLRNIRISMDAKNWTIDLVPSVVLDAQIGKAPPSGNPTNDQINRILEGSRIIVEGEKLLRAEFSSVQACVVQEEFVEMFDTFKLEPNSYPLLEKGKGCFPFLLVENSKWQATLPDYQGGEWVDLKHYKLVSMETHLNLLGILDSIEWVRNPGAD